MPQTLLLSNEWVTLDASEEEAQFAAQCHTVALVTLITPLLLTKCLWLRGAHKRPLRKKIDGCAVVR